MAPFRQPGLLPAGASCSWSWWGSPCRECFMRGCQTLPRGHPQCGPVPPFPSLPFALSGSHCSKTKPSFQMSVLPHPSSLMPLLCCHLHPLPWPGDSLTPSDPSPASLLTTVLLPWPQSLPFLPPLAPASPPFQSPGPARSWLVPPALSSGGIFQQASSSSWSLQSGSTHDHVSLTSGSPSNVSQGHRMGPA